MTTPDKRARLNQMKPIGKFARIAPHQVVMDGEDYLWLITELEQAWAVIPAIRAECTEHRKIIDSILNEAQRDRDAALAREAKLVEALEYYEKQNGVIAREALEENRKAQGKE